MELGIRLLGSPIVLLDGTWTALRASKASALLALTAHRGAPVRRAEVAALMWPDADDHDARNNLRQLLSSISEGQLAPLMARDHTAVWATAASDVQAFTAAINAGRLADAVDLYQGPLLDGFELADAGEFGWWATSERADLESRWRRACLVLIDEHERAGDHVRVLELGERLLRADPFDEVALRHAVRAAAASGDGHGARRRLAAFRDALAIELGLEPEAATLALLEELPGTLALAPLPAPDPSKAPQRATGSALTALAPRLRGQHRVIGRDSDLAALVELILLEDTRLLTLLAPGGMGKTTLAGALVDEVGKIFSDGVVIVLLDRISGPDSLTNAVVGAFALSLQPGRPPLAQLVAALASRHALVVLDGFESHFASANVVDELLRGCPQLKLLVTSRARLNHSAEVVYDVGPLATAAAHESETQGAQEPPMSDAGRLFHRAASLSAGAWRPTQRDYAQIERLCHAVGGNPLAIELVARWLDLLSLDQAERRVSEGWELLRADSFDLPPGRRDLQATIEESYLQLAPEDQQAWERLSVFPGTLDKSVAAEVAGTGWSGLRRLADRAILRNRDNRLELHALLARYGRERASQSGADVTAWRAALPIWRERISLETDPHTGRRLRVHPHDLEQAFEAWRFAVSEGEWAAVAEMTYGLLRALALAARGLEFISAAANAVSKLQSEAGRNARSALARLLPFAGSASSQHLPFANTAAQLNEPFGEQRDNETTHKAAAIAEELGDARALATAYAALLFSEPAVDARGRFERARAAFEAAGDDVGLAKLLYDRGEQLCGYGHVTEAEGYLNEAVALYRRLGDQVGEAHAHDILSTRPLLRGDVQAARQLLRLASELFRSAGSAHVGGGSKMSESWLAQVEGDRELAARLVEEAIEEERPFGDTRLVEAIVKCTFHATFMEFEQVVVNARTILELSASPTHASLLTLRAQQLLARALVATGDLPQAAGHIAQAARMTRELDAPLYVPRVAMAAGALAWERGRSDEARLLLCCAWQHPLREPRFRRDLERCLAVAGVESPSNKDLAFGDEELLRLSEAEARLARGEGAG